MAADYPGAVKNFLTLEDGVDTVLAQHMNERGNEITAIETELGADVAGSMSDLVARLTVALNDNGTIKAASVPTGFVKVASGSYTGNATVGTAVAHGLGVKPVMVEIFSQRDNTADHGLWITGMGANQVNLVGRQLRTTTDAPDATNFYLTATNANNNAIVYYWVAYAKQA